MKAAHGLMLALATSASIALSLPLGTLLGFPWGGLTAGLIGGAATLAYQLRQQGRATGQPEEHPTTTTTGDDMKAAQTADDNDEGLSPREKSLIAAAGARRLAQLIVNPTDAERAMIQRIGRIGRPDSCAWPDPCSGTCGRPGHIYTEEN